jgi:hypothetical protein
MIGNSSSSSSGCKRSVHFPLEEEHLSTVALIIESVDDLSQQDKKTLWFSRSDYQFSRSSARVIAKESERYGHSKHLDNVYIPAFDQQVQYKLNLWALHGSTRRGIERWANSSHGNLRKKDQHVYVNGVIRAQTEMKLKDTDQDTLEERLREVGEMLSQKSRFFAEMLGSADAQAAKWEFGITDVAAAPALSPRQLLMKSSSTRKNIGLGSATAGLLAARRAATRRSAPNIQPNIQGISRALPNSRQRASAATISPSASTRRSPRTASTRTSPRTSIQMKSARVPRMA